MSRTYVVPVIETVEYAVEVIADSAAEAGRISDIVFGNLEPDARAADFVRVIHRESGTPTTARVRRAK